MRAEAFQRVAHAAVTGRNIRAALNLWAKLLKRTPRGVKTEIDGDNRRVWAAGNLGFVRGMVTREDWRQAVIHLDVRAERFHFASFVFDISMAKRLARRHGSKIRTAVPTEDWWTGLRPAIRVNPEHLAAELDMSKPIIFGTLLSSPRLTLLLDGNHRATRAMQQGLEIPYVILTFQQTLKTIQKRGERLRRLRRRVIDAAQYYQQQAQEQEQNG